MAAPHLPDITEIKAAAREAAYRARERGDPRWGTRLAGHVLWHRPPPPGAVIAGFWPLAGEIDLRPLLFALAGRGHRMVLPETTPRGQVLRFRIWRPGSAMLPGRWGTFYPDGEEARPDWLLVPLLAWDDAGRRLGYGGGYYDRTIAGLEGCYRLGCAFACQRVAEVPAGPRDMRMDAIATELGVTVVTA